MDLNIDADELNQCVQCGLCLPHCPTFRVTGDETMSPRGRIALMRAVQDGSAPMSNEVVDAFETCLQCRGCEPACPSGVPYGSMMERTREAMADADLTAPRWQQLGMEALKHPKLLRSGTSALAGLQRVGLVPKRLGLPDLELRHVALEATGTDVYLFTGCVMDAMQRSVHQDAMSVLHAAGLGATPTGDLAPCCGALHTHAGLGDDSRSMAEQLIASLSTDDRPTLVDSAGCGAAMKEYGHLLGTEAAEAFSERVYDLFEYLEQHLDALPSASPLALKVAVQDPCHLRHVQKVHGATRSVLAPYVAQLVELVDDGLCCGAGGAYSVLQPELAGDIRDRKIAAIEAVTPDVVASANPGCGMHLAAGGVVVKHPIELVAQALREDERQEVSDR